MMRRRWTRRIVDWRDYGGLPNEIEFEDVEKRMLTNNWRERDMMRRRWTRRIVDWRH
jgi:phage terminase large subunit-like protein